MQPESTYPPSQASVAHQQPVVAQQPGAKASMTAAAVPEGESTQNEPLRLRGGCPGHFCGLPILPCRVNICVFPIPCC